jgi:hypothetical protein
MSDTITDAQVQTSSTRSTQVREDSTAINPRGKGEGGTADKINGLICKRAARTVRSRSNYDFTSSFAGGILDQLIKDAENRLEKVQAFIDWYEDEKQETLERLENLRRLREIEEQQFKAQSESEIEPE